VKSVTLTGISNDDAFCVMFYRGVQESMIQVKSVLRETDSRQFEDAMKMSSAQRKMYATKQDEQERKDLDRKWDRLNY